MCTGKCIIYHCCRQKVFPAKIILHCPRHGFQPGREDIFSFRCGIWNNAWSKNQTRSHNFEIQASNSLSNLAVLTLFKSASKSALVDPHGQATAASSGKLQERGRLHQSSQEPADRRRGRKCVKTQKDSDVTDGESSELLHWSIWSSSRGRKRAAEVWIGFGERHPHAHCGKPLSLFCKDGEQRSLLYVC